MSFESKTPELLAPAGDLTCVDAAVENGADAVYFGLDRGYNARHRATNLSLETLPDVMRQLRRRRVRGYVTLNTLVFPGELSGFEKIVRQVARAGVDAVLVQDLGAARLIREVCPDLPIHASTQMTITCSQAMDVIASLGVERVVLARELSIDDIRRIAGQTTMPLEVFVHGALCVAYSGQCLTSESLGGRSANRGHCAQACRLPYELVCDGRDVDLEQQKYLLSPQDLAAYELIPQLIDAGVCALKIEGRLKSPEYVAHITRRYREAIDMAVNRGVVRFKPSEVEEMELSFSRGFSPGWLEGCDHKRLVPGLHSAKRGVLLGHVRSVEPRGIRVALLRSVKPGDGVVFADDRSLGEEGGRVYQVVRQGRQTARSDDIDEVELRFGKGAVDSSGLRAGQAVWKTDDPELTRRWRRSFGSTRPNTRTPISVRALAQVGEPLRLEAQIHNGPGCVICSDEPLQAARKHPLTEALLWQQLGRLGSTPYQLGQVELEMGEPPMVPLSVLGRLRHSMVQELDRLLSQPPDRPLAPHSVLDQLRPSREPVQTAVPALHALCRSLHQLQIVLEFGIRLVYADFQDVRQYRHAVELAHRHDARILLATPRIHKPGEIGIFRAMKRHAPDGILARNLAAIDFFTRCAMPVVADYSLNVANELTAAYLRQLGAERMTPSYDLNRDQLLELVEATPASWLEIVIHQHMPMFHMEHCVFCAVLSPGTDKTNCGRPCDLHQVQLRDRVGMQHPLHADVGCRNTLFNAQPQSSAEIVTRLLADGVRHFRVELLDASPSAIRETLQLYQKLLAGDLSGQQIWTQLKASNRVGVTRGTLEPKRDPLAIL